MATTETWLQTKETGELAFSLVFDGYNLVCTTTSDTSGIATAFSSTDWTTVKGHLDIIGETSQSIDPFQPQIKPSSLTFRVLDVDGTFRQLLLGNPSTVDSCPLKETLSASATSVLAQAGSTSGFAASGTAYIGHEAFSYSSISSGTDEDTFTVTNRGMYSLFGIDGGTRIGRRHAVQTDTKVHPRVTVPEIRSVPNVWYNRMVGLVLHHAEYSGAGAKTWATATLPFSDANAQMLWCGRIKAWSDEGDGWISIQCTSIDEALRSALWLDQYQAELFDGIVVTDADASFAMVETSTPSSQYGTLSGAWSSSFTSAAYRYDELVSAIQAKLTAAQQSTHKWSIEIRDTDAGPRCVVAVDLSAAATIRSRFILGVGQKVANLLGFSPRFTQTYSSGGKTRIIHGIELIAEDENTRTRYVAIAQAAPKLAVNPNALRPGDVFVVRRSTGTWYNQPSVPIDVDATAEGFVVLGDRVFAVTYDTGKNVGGHLLETFSIVFSMQPATVPNPHEDVAIDEVAPPLTVKQIWRERGKAGDLLLKILLSTGTEDYNSSTYDVYGSGFGLGLPYRMIDVESFRSLDVQYELLLSSSEAFGKILEEVLAVYNRHLIFEDGKLRLVSCGFDVPVADDIITLDETTKAHPMDRSTMTVGTDGIINRLKLEYTHVDIVKNTKQFRNNYFEVLEHTVPVVVADLASESDYGHRRELAIKARGVLDPDGWVKYVADPILRYFSHPMAHVSRTINAKMFHLTPGDLVKITDDYLVDPTTGERGVSGLAGWVQSVSIDWRARAGRVEILFLPTHPASRYALISPSALIDHTHGTGDYDAGYDPVNHKLKLVAKTFGRTADDNDIFYFNVDDTIQVKERSPADPADPVVLTGTIASIDTGANEITLTGALGGDAWDNTLKYVVEARGYANATTEQRAYAQIGDDAAAEQTALASTVPAKLWSGPYKSLLTHSTTVDYDTEFICPSDNDDADGEPLSARKLHDLCLSLNSLLSYKTRNVLVSEAQFFAERTTTSTSYVLVWGPQWVPLYGLTSHDSVRRKILGKVRLKTSGGVGGTVTARLVSSPTLPIGNSNTTPTYVFTSTSQEETSTAVAYTWVDIDAFAAAATSRGGQIGTFLTLEIKIDNGAFTAHAHGLAVVEAALS